ncbi:hypothetical protein [Persephonella sp.]
MSRIIIFLLIFAVPVFAGNVRLKEPPGELKKYYPPESDGYPFVELMHNLSISLTATISSIEEKDWKRGERWVLAFKKNYFEIGKKVRKWDKLLKKKAVENLVLSVQKKDLKGFKQNLQIVGKSCIQCHKNYKISTRVIYRFPSFHAVSIEDPVTEREISYEDYMKKMTDDMKRLKIYVLDGKRKKALRSGVDFVKRFESLKQSCSDCHSGEDSTNLYFSDKVKKGLSMVKDGLRRIEKDKIFEGLKFIGVYNCTKCHNTHIIQAELQERFKTR